MDLKRLQGALDCFFDRAIIAISYSAASRLLDTLTSPSGHGPGLSLQAIGLGVMGTLLLLPPALRRNECLETTLCILSSKAGIYACAPLEPNALRAGWVLPGILCFFVYLYSALCGAVWSVLPFEGLRAQWERVVPFVVIFSTTTILRAVLDGGELRVLHVAALCHLLLWQQAESCGGYCAQFVDSIMARGLLMVLEDLIVGSAPVPGFGLCLVFGAYVVVLGVFFPTRSSSRQWQVCLGVLTYKLCVRLVEAVQALCDQQIGVTFAVLVAALTALMYQSKTEDLTPICSNAMGILWSTMLDDWVFSFYQTWEQVLMYLMLFWSVQSLRTALSPVLEKSALVSRLAVVNTDTEVMLIGREVQQQ